ncbi:MAG: nicotinate-nucleotide adenylyltransferase [Gammaproteobacteria bacterium]|nr:nicotinate-nucleotide adenylyltransferase [Gammaproteobacteria bacterium]
MIGLLGGTFDPIHLGHLSIATDVQQHLNLNSVEFVPCKVPVHKQQPNVPVDARLAMLQLALQDYPQFNLNRCEVDRESDSFMIDTLKSMASETNEPLVLILGTDAFNGLHLWKQASSILDYCHIVVCQRPGDQMRQKQYDNYWTKEAESLTKQPSSLIYSLIVTPIPCSSTNIRQNVKSAGQYLPQSVLEFIKLNHLYTSNKINV